jgi:hypothetical protein
MNPVTTAVRVGRPTIRITNQDGTETVHVCPEQPLPPAPKRSRGRGVVGTIMVLLVMVGLALLAQHPAAAGGVMMAASVIPIAFKKMLYTGRAWKAALYVGAANLSNATVGYSAVNEVVGAGYVAGGKVLVSYVIDGSDGVTVLLDYDDVSWPASSFTARYILIYDNNAPNKEGYVIDMGQDQQVSGGTFTIEWPAADLLTAIFAAA